ncbi:MAG: major capsid protein, partial [Enterococcus avium]|nr:major capsid protein [Enterococcus avium]
ESNLDPVGTWTKAAGTALPSFPEADNVFQATVLAEA